MASSPLMCEWPCPRLPIFPVSPGLTLPSPATWWAQQIFSHSLVFSSTKRRSPCSCSWSSVAWHLWSSKHLLRVAGKGRPRLCRRGGEMPEIKDRASLPGVNGWQPQAGMLYSPVPPKCSSIMRILCHLPPCYSRTCKLAFGSPVVSFNMRTSNLPRDARLSSTAPPCRGEQIKGFFFFFRVRSDEWAPLRLRKAFVVGNAVLCIA